MKAVNTVVVSLTLGAIFGATTSLVNWLSTPADAGGGPIANTAWESIARVASLILDSGWAWAGLAVAVGWLVNARVRGAVAGFLALLAAPAAYSVVETVREQHGLAWHGGDLGYWGVAAVLFGPILGAVGASIRRPGVVGLVASLTVSAGAAVQMIVLPPGAGGLAERPEDIWARGIVLAAAAGVAGLLIIRFVAASAVPSVPAPWGHRWKAAR